MRAGVAIAAVAAGLLTGCASNGDMGAANYAFTVQNKYDHLKCKDILVSIKGQEAEVAKYEALSAKAGQSGAGSLIAATTYRPNLTDAQGNLRVLRGIYAKKNCEAELKAGG